MASGLVFWLSCFDAGLSAVRVVDGCLWVSTSRRARRGLRTYSRLGRGFHLVFSMWECMLCDGYGGVLFVLDLGRWVHLYFYYILLSLNL